MQYGSNTFLYDSSGIRVQKNSTYYYTENGTVILEKSDNRIIFYNYDQDGLTSIYVRTLDNGVYHSSTYYVRKSLQGDIIALYAMSGYALVLVCTYKYDAWGRCKVYNPDGSENITSTFIGNINPIRYRGYYYDSETCLYYLQSRYFDPETGRFINADDGRILGIGMNVIGGTNLFTYCLNNPIMDTDPSGHFSLKESWEKYKESFAEGISVISELLTDVKSDMNSFTANIAARGNLLIGSIDGNVMNTLNLLSSNDLASMSTFEIVTAIVGGLLVGGGLVAILGGAIMCFIPGMQPIGIAFVVVGLLMYNFGTYIWALGGHVLLE